MKRREGEGIPSENVFSIVFLSVLSEFENGRTSKTPEHKSQKALQIHANDGNKNLKQENDFNAFNEPKTCENRVPQPSK